MALFRPKICSVCGREYRGLGFQCKGGLLKAVWRVTGRAVLGAFFPRDKVLLVSGGAGTTLELDDVETVAPAAASRGSLFWKRAYGGTIASFTVTARGSIGPGNMIVKE